MGMTKERFTALWTRCLVDGAVAEASPVYQDLVRRYSEPHRHYHTCDHINHCLKQLDMASSLMDDPDAVEMGLWFHDVVYDPRASDNELRSAELFTDLVDGHFRPAFRRSVYGLIMATVHPEHPKCLDEQFIVDIDLSSFGLPWEAFKRDSEAVRAEKAHHSDEQFFQGQVKFLRALLERPTFFFTDFFRTRYEATARNNITRYINDLRVRGYC